MGTRLSILLLAIVPLSSCEEFLPPRIDPRDIDVTTVLEGSMRVDGGIVLFEERDSVSRSTAGTAYITVRNIHDEALSGLENIDVKVRYWLLYVAGDTVVEYGDRNNLLNAYEPQGTVFMLDGDLLTILPDSSAILLVQWDHVPARFWEKANPKYVQDSCSFPPCDDYIITDPVDIASVAEVTLFASQATPIFTVQSSFSIFYFFDVASISSVTFDSASASVVGNDVEMQWTTSYEFGVYSFQVQRSARPDSGFEVVEGGEVEPKWVGPEVVSYSVFDEPPTGRWFYRVAVLEYFYPVGVVVVDVTAPVEVSTLTTAGRN